MRKHRYDELDMGMDTTGGNANDEAEDGQGDNGGEAYQCSGMPPSNSSM